MKNININANTLDTMNTMKEVAPMITVTIKANEDIISEERRIELEEAIEMALTMISDDKDYLNSPNYPDDWKALAEALKNVRGI